MNAPPVLVDAAPAYMQPSIRELPDVLEDLMYDKPRRRYANEVCAWFRRQQGNNLRSLAIGWCDVPALVLIAFPHAVPAEVITRNEPFLMSLYHALSQHGGPFLYRVYSTAQGMPQAEVI